MGKDSDLLGSVGTFSEACLYFTRVGNGGIQVHLAPFEKARTRRGPLMPTQVVSIDKRHQMTFGKDWS